MAWLTFYEAVDALRQRFEETEGFSPAQRVLIVDILYRWQQELHTQERAPGERRRCAACGQTVPPEYVVDSTKRPAHLLCPDCWHREVVRARLAKEREDKPEWDSLFAVLEDSFPFEEE
jgi:DNA-directed RNA polymerase subunit RPC12/RpoP